MILGTTGKYASGKGEIAAYLQLSRPLNCIMATLGCFAGYAIANNSIAVSSQAIIAMAAVFLVCAGGQAINDYFDRNIDAKLHPEKPIPSGRIAPKKARLFSLALFAAGILVSLFLPLHSALIAIAFSALLFLYSAFFQKKKFLANYVVALGTAFTIIFGASVSGNMLVPAILAASAFFANASREITKDMEDMPADRKYKLSLPMLVRKRTVLAVILLYYAIAVAFAFLPYYYGIFGNPPYLVLAFASSIGFLYSFWLSVQEKYSVSQIASKASMALALIGFAAGVL